MTLDEINRQKYAALVERKGLCEHLLGELPQGCMVMSRKKGRNYYSINQKGKRLALKRDDPLVTKFCDRKLVERVLAGINQAITEIENGKRCRAVFDPNELLELLPKAYRTPSSAVFQEMGFEDARNWATANYYKNEKYPEHLTVKTKSGILVRSRIESGIMDIYEEFGIPVRYEEAFRLPSGELIFPDFRPLIPGVFRLLFHEHAGLMHDPEYVKHEFLWKQEKYARAGLVVGRDVLFTFDGFNGEVDYGLLRQQIKEFIDYNRSL